MTAYSRGANFERRVADWYEEQGFEVIRSAGSHGACDVVALMPSLVIFNSLRITPYWSPVERETFEWIVKRLGIRGRYVWRGDKHDGYKIYFKEVE